MKKTNAMRILDELGIPYEANEYDESEIENLGHGLSLALSQKLGIDSECVFKTIVMRTDKNEIVVFCQCAQYEVNLKKARAACGAKKVFPVKADELLELTGYIRGGCTPIGMKHKFRTFIDETVMLHDKVYVSAGTRTSQLILAPQDLIKATDAQLADLIL